MSKKDEEIMELKNELETLRARIENLEDENKQLRLRAKGLDQKYRKLKQDTDGIIETKTKEVDNLKEKIINLGKQAEKVLDSKNREIEKLGGMVKERSFAVKSSQSIDIPSHSVIHGAILSEDSISIGDNVMVDGHLDSGGSLLIGSQVTIKGVVRAVEDVTVQDESEIQGDMESGGSVFLGPRSQVGSIQADGSVDIGERSSASKIMARGDVALGNGARVSSGIRYGGSVAIGKQTSVKGTIEFYEEEESDDQLFAEAEEKRKSRPKEEVQTPPRNDSNSVKEDSRDSKGKSSCPICGTPVTPGSRKCSGCGSIIREVPGKSSDQKEEDVAIPHHVGKRKVPRRR